MTGFGAAEGPVGGGALRVEIRSVNHRYFHLALRAPSEVLALEAELRDRLKREFERGHLAVQVRWTTSPDERTGGIKLNLVRAERAMARLRELQTAVGIQGEITLDLLSRQPEVFAQEDGNEGIEWPALEVVVADAAAKCRAMRQQEGKTLAQDLAVRLTAIRERAALVASRAPERLTRERDRLRSSIALLLEGRAVDDDRLAQEIALMADKLDISEELVRLGAHLEVCFGVLGSDKAIGKQLGFLAQEIGREINTIGSKANDAAIQHAVVEMKGDLERFREQIENLE